MSIQNCWSELPEELLRIIAEKINSVHDFVTFGLVCHSWRSVVNDDKHKPHFSSLLKPFPWLMLTADEDEDDRCFFIPSENRVTRLYLPEAIGCHCWGSPSGWLVTFSFDQQFHLLNPLTRIQLPLPPRSTFQDRIFIDAYPGHNRMHCVDKAFVSTDENNQVVLVYLILGEFQQLAFARPGDTTWTVTENSNCDKDVINFNDQIYTVQTGWETRLCCLQVSDPQRPTLIHFADLPDYVRPARIYLVELGGELHLVMRKTVNTQNPIVLEPEEFHHYEKTIYFKVFKLDLSSRKWDELETLGDYALFLGSNTTFALQASNYPECKAGCIYYTDDICSLASLTGHDMGIYNLEAHTFESLYQGDDILSRFSPPVWITPNPF